MAFIHKCSFILFYSIQFYSNNYMNLTDNRVNKLS